LRFAAAFGVVGCDFGVAAADFGVVGADFSADTVDVGVVGADFGVFATFCVAAAFPLGVAAFCGPGAAAVSVAAAPFFLGVAALAFAFPASSTSPAAGPRDRFLPSDIAPPLRASNLCAFVAFVAFAPKQTWQNKLHHHGVIAPPHHHTSSPHHLTAGSS
jgi:hypothetical protein